MLFTPLDLTSALPALACLLDHCLSLFMFLALPS